MSKIILALGPEGTNSHQAVSHFSADVKARVVFCRTNRQALQRFSGGEGDFAVVPVENSSKGLIREVVDFWLGPESKKLFVVGETAVSIRHCLLVKALEDGRPSIGMGDVKEVFSHFEALGQCSEKIHSFDLSETPVSSTAEAAKLVKESKSGSAAAIASAFAGSIYGLTALDSDFQNHNGNTTRFYLVGRSPAPKSGNSLTAIIFWLKDEPGQLHRALGALKIGREYLNMSSIHSIPLGHSGQFAFYTELEGCQSEGGMKKALLKFRGRVASMRILGSFPKYGPVRK